MTEQSSLSRRPGLFRLVGLAFVLGVLGFGGGYSVAQRVRRAVVDRHGWLANEDFLEALSVASSLPGTTATNLFTFLGHRLAGPTGACFVTVAFLAPSVAIMIVFGASYDRLRDLGAVGSMLDGMGVATVGVIAAVVVDMRTYSIKDRLGLVLAMGTTVALATRLLSLLEAVAIGGMIGAFALRPPGRASPDERRSPPSLRGVLAFAPATALAASPLLALFFVFAKIGVATFGGGVAMISPMEHEVVQIHRWLSQQTFNDAIVLGQITPGPVAITATFIGYRVSGLLGAAATTIGMFGPPFVLTVAAARAMPIFRTRRAVRGFLAGVAPVVVGAIAAAAFALAQTAVHTWWQGIVALAVFALLVWRPKLSPLVPLLGAGVIELAVHAFLV